MSYTSLSGLLFSHLQSEGVGNFHYICILLASSVCQEPNKSNCNDKKHDMHSLESAQFGEEGQRKMRQFQLGETSRSVNTAE